MRANDDGRVGVPAAHRRGNRLQIEQRRVGRLIAIARILPEQPVNHFFEGARQGGALRAQRRDRRRHVLEQNRSHAVAVKGGLPREALMQNDSDRVQVRGGRQVVLDGTGLFGRRVARQFEHLATPGAIHLDGADGTEVHERSRIDGSVRRGHDVRGTYAAMQHTLPMQIAQGGQERMADRHRLGGIEPSGFQALRERASWRKSRYQPNATLLAADMEDAGKPRAFQADEQVGLVFQPHQRARIERRLADRLDDDDGVVQIHRQKRARGAALAERLLQPVAPGYELPWG